jgi:hypothetical protein
VNYAIAPSPSPASQAFEWGTAADVATTLGTFIAAVAIVVTLIMNLRSERLTRAGQQIEREQSEAAAARTEAAAALTEEYTRRVVESLETIARSGSATGREPTRRGVRWSLTHHQGDTYLLENVGDETATSVKVSTHESLSADMPDIQDVEPGAGLAFTAAPSLATRDRTVTVSWWDADVFAENGIGTRTWKYPLPPRPSLLP